MLINYEFANFRSFKSTAALSMEASSRTDSENNLVKWKNLELLPSAVIYGANASGKSNVIKSMELLQNTIATGNLSPVLLHTLALCPFVHDNGNKPIHFYIDFISNEIRFEYILDISVGKMKPEGYIVYEKLSVIVFESLFRIFTIAPKYVII